MKHCLWLATVALLAASCGGDSTPAPPPSNQTVVTESDAAPAPAPAEERRGTIKTRLFRRDAVDGETVVPSLEVISPSAGEVEPGVWEFNDTQVTIIGLDGQRTLMTAKKGTLDQNDETAELSVEVVVKMGTQTITTDHLSWNNEKRLATAENGVTIVDGETLLTAKSMRFSPDENTLTLVDVTGTIRLPEAGPLQESRRGVWRTLAMWVVMATPAYAQAGGTEYTHVQVDVAPEVLFRDNRLEHMTGGVEIQLKTSNPADPPLRLGAKTILFGWTDDDSTELAALDLTGDVHVLNADGYMRAADAAFNVTKMTIAFTGGVSGQFEGIDEFRADRLTYDIESGDMEMHDLTATIPFGDSQGGDADGFSNMEVERAGVVRVTESRVQEMRGDVAVKLAPVGGGKPIALGADSFGFTYGHTDQRQPDVVSMSGAVRVDAPQGLIQSDSAEFNVARNSLTFRDRVRGNNDMMNGFSANFFEYDLDTEDGELRSFSAKGVKFGADGGYDRMDVRKAPKVRMQGGRVTKMSDGVEIYLEGNDEQDPVTANAESIDIGYADSRSNAPSSVDMNGDVHVIMGDINVRSDAANLDMTAEKAVFSGNPVADLPRAKGVTGAAIVYDLKTGNVSLPGGIVPEIMRRDSESAPELP